MKSLINKLFPHTKSQEEAVITQSSLFTAKVPNLGSSNSSRSGSENSQTLNNTRFVQPIPSESKKVA